ncbi:alkaline phosphatase family protein [Salinithrix halophila]|uniref:Alkaline phosphatase family protein n=1 Tax=Salinithrix halophila TaxID=1485204 RepID=A0ABV8JHL1_9BACL
MRWWVVGIILGGLLILYFFRRPRPEPRERGQKQERLNPSRKGKPVIWLMTDSLMAHAIDKGVDSGELPALGWLTEHGQYYREVVSSFPTMSVNIDATLLTGVCADHHRIPGLIWYDPGEKRIVNYGTALGEVVRNGPNRALKDGLIRLNRDHLNPEVKTLFDDMREQEFQSGAVNPLVYRGPATHFLRFPAWISGPTSLPEKQEVKGPDFLALGTFINPLKDETALPDGILDSLGFGDTYSLAVTTHLIRESRLPDFLFVYLSDLDKSLHKKGPSEIEGVRKLDQHIGELLDAFGSWEQALQGAIWVVCGDSGQTGVLSSGKDPVIPLHHLFEGYQLLQPGKTADSETEIALCVNERSAFVYPLNEKITMLELVEKLRSDHRIDLLVWLEEDWAHVLHTHLKTELWFRPGGDWIDPFDQRWEIRGDFAALDMTPDHKKRTLTYGEYPDPLMRLHASLHSHQARFMIVNAKPGYELAAEYSPLHKGGGGHGSLHHVDSFFPLIITGTKEQPKYLRMVDLKEYILRVLREKKSSH